MDVGRYFRAQETAEALKVERLHDGYLAGEIEAADVPAGVWAQIQQHNQLARKRRP